MKITKTAIISTLVSVVVLATVAFAETTVSNPMPMMQGQQGGMPMMQGQQGNIPMMQMMGMMQQRHAVMDVHMQKMETHMQNIETLLQRLVDAKEK